MINFFFKETSWSCSIPWKGIWWVFPVIPSTHPIVLSGMDGSDLIIRSAMDERHKEHRCLKIRDRATGWWISSPWLIGGPNPQPLLWPATLRGESLPHGHYLEVCHSSKSILLLPGQCHATSLSSAMGSVVCMVGTPSGVYGDQFRTCFQ